MTPLTMHCVTDYADTITASGMYGAPGKNIAINVTEDGRAGCVYLDPDQARRLHNWLVEALRRAESTKEGETP